jgi:hypothetical protein
VREITAAFVLFAVPFHVYEFIVWAKLASILPIDAANGSMQQFTSAIENIFTSRHAVANVPGSTGNVCVDMLASVHLEPPHPNGEHDARADERENDKAPLDCRENALFPLFAPPVILPFRERVGDVQTVVRQKFF